MSEEHEIPGSERFACGRWLSLVKAGALLGGAIFVFFVARDPGRAPREPEFSEIGRWSDVEGRGEIEWTSDGMERLHAEGFPTEERAYRVTERSDHRFVVEREFTAEERSANPSWKTGKVVFQILSPDRIRRDFSAEAGVAAMEFTRVRP